MSPARRRATRTDLRRRRPGRRLPGALSARQGLRGRRHVARRGHRAARRPAPARRRRRRCAWSRWRRTTSAASCRPSSAAAPDEIYNLAGQTSVGLSFEQPVETIESIVIGVLNLLEAIRFVERPIAFYNAGSSECFGDTGEHRGDGGHALPAAQPLCGRQGLRAQPGGQLPRRLSACAPAPASCSTTSRRCGPNASSRRRWCARPAASPPAATRRCRWATSTSTATGAGRPSTSR